MKIQRTTGLIVFLGIFLILAGIVTGKAVSSYVVKANGPIGMGKIIVTQKVTSEKNNPITVGDIERLKKAIEVNEIAYSSEEKAFVQGSRQNVETNIVGTNSIYSKFSNMKLAEGSFFTEKAERETRCVAVIDQKLAVKLFNTEEAVGNEIAVFGKIFIVIGVTSADSSIIAGLIDDDKPDIYIPASTFFELNKNASITHIEIKSTYSDTLGNNVKLVVKGLESINRNPDNYKVIDFNIVHASLNNKPGLLIFLYGLITILVSVFYIKREISSLAGLIKKEVKIEYFSSVLKKNLIALLLLSVKIISIAGFIVLIWNLIKFRCYIPPELIPADLTDIGYFKDLVHNSIVNGNRDLAYIASRPEKILEISEKIINVFFITSLFPGLIFFYIGLNQARVLKTDTFKLLLQLGISLISSLLVLAGIIYYFKLSININMSFLTIIWVFVCVNSVGFGMSTERGDTYGRVN